jgi:hypothetical protein
MTRKPNTARGRPDRERQAIRCRAAEIRETGQRVNKSRIARELHVHISTVFRALPRVSV